MDDIYVASMAEAIERRRIERGLTPGEFAAAAGLSRPGLQAVRKGRRKKYHDKVKLGVARALGWEPDAIDRLLEGQEPVDAENSRETDDGIGDRVARIERQMTELTDQFRELRDAVALALRPPTP